MKKDLLYLRNNLLKAGLKKEARYVEGLIKEAISWTGKNCTDTAKYKNHCVIIDGSTNKPDTNGKIYKLQIELNNLDSTTPIKADGWFGDKTKDKVKKLWKDYDENAHTIKQIMDALTKGKGVSLSKQTLSEI